MLKISQTHLDIFRQRSNSEWIARHVKTMSELLPDVAAMYSETEFKNIIVRILLRADQRGVFYENATIAFSYASLTLGIGFEDGDNFIWAPDALAAEPSKQADAIWNGIEAELGKPHSRAAST